MERPFTFSDLTLFHAARLSILTSYHFTQHARSQLHNQSFAPYHGRRAPKVENRKTIFSTVQSTFIENNGVFKQTYNLFSSISQSMWNKIKHKSKTNTRLLNKIKYKLGLTTKKSLLNIPIRISPRHSKSMLSNLCLICSP